MKRAVLQSFIIVLLAAGVATAWLLRPVIQNEEQNIIPIQVATGCDSAQRSCRIAGDGIEFEVSFGPPVRTMEAFAVAVRQVRGTLGADAQVEVQFQMRDMDMGLNRYRLTVDAAGVWRGQAMLPVCSAGRSDWLAQVTITVNGKTWQALLPFVVGG